MSLNGKVIVITGAGPGLGRTLARRLAQEDATVVVAARSAEPLAEIARETGALAVPTDVRDPAQVESLTHTVLNRFNTVDVLVNAAFPGTHRKNVLDMDPEYLELWRSAVETATYGTLLACRYLVPPMVRAGRGAVVNLTSMSSRVGYAGRSDYAAGKAGVHLLSHCLADELGPLGVGVNCVAPGWIAGDTLADWMRTRAAAENTTYEAILAHDVGRMALRRIPSGADVAEAVVLLADDERSGSVTGATIDVNGGQQFT